MSQGGGIDRRTGQPLTGWAHVVQSVFVILSTRIGARVMRRGFGSAASGIIGRRMTPATLALYRLLVVVSLERWEPRVRVRSIRPTATVDAARAGSLGLSISVDWLPRGHLGDTTVAGVRDLEV